MRITYKDLIPQNKAIDQSWSRLQTNRTSNWDLYGYDIGIHPLNMAIGGIIPTRVTVIGGRSGSGKTALLCPMLEATLRRKHDGSRVEFLFFTWELDPSIVIDRAICSRVGVTLREFNQGAKLLSERAMAQIKATYEVASQFPVVYHNYTTNIHEVKAVALDFIKVCREKSAQEKVYVHPVIVIDYLNMAQFTGDGLRTYGIADFMNGLKQLCNHERCSAIVFAQLSRETDRLQKMPDRADFSDSSAIENAADNLIVVWRPEYHNIHTVIDPTTGNELDSRHKMLIRVLKGRDYGIGDFLINCDIKYFRFWDLAHSWDTKYFSDYQTEKFWLDEFKLQPAKTAVVEEIPF